MLIYQPSAWKGKLLKRWFPLVSRLDWFGIIKQALHIDVCDFPFDDEVICYLKKQFECDEIWLSLFMGTPSMSQKITIQVASGRKILGYCKLAKSAEILKLFRKEQIILESLREKEITNVPTCLDVATLSNGHHTFVQTTRKKRTSDVLHCLSDLHVDFLDTLVERTSVNIAYDHTEYAQLIEDLMAHTCSMNPEDIDVINKVYDCIVSHFRSVKQFCVCHADFTPWNSYYENGTLEVFDFEYAMKTCPTYIDLFHFVGQTAWLEDHLDAANVYQRSKKSYRWLIGRTESPEMVYLAYLLFIFAFYSKLFQWNFPASDAGYQLWVGEMKIWLNENTKE